MWFKFVNLLFCQVWCYCYPINDYCSKKEEIKIRKSPAFLALPRFKHQNCLSWVWKSIWTAVGDLKLRFSCYPLYKYIFNLTAINGSSCARKYSWEFPHWDRDIVTFNEEMENDLWSYLGHMNVLICALGMMKWKVPASQHTSHQLLSNICPSLLQIPSSLVSPPKLPHLGKTPNIVKPGPVMRLP